ncbi:DUF3040 domain-containing protein [Paeniglutamicibacter terrestris]|uniref:DUF3040 domain-containing protein n=1 Tax=Paeniglutamicibacter terrestris TaxID=2723403 RepID=A0ABX1G9A7_9MICC|nr:DUF3040 domain-containing protein [Paeniglutamicibacter terrestris]ASN38913.1 hypothetical protein CGQ24_07755 [Arthrobacter sp. 7749]NKG22291.1 DUF3040 domain-containing protein [Paeniglutamicibacter terrestris]
MPLSEHEQRLLEQLEKQLHEDHRFASTMKSASTAGNYSTRNLALGALTGIVGLGVLIYGVSSQLILIGVLGFIVMFAGVYLALSRRGGTKKTGLPGAPKGPQKSGFMSDLENKWEQRKRDEHGSS